MPFNQLKLGTKLSMIFGALIFMVACGGIYSLSAMIRIDGKWVDFETVINKKESVTANAIENLGNAVQNYKDYVLRAKDYDGKFLKSLDDIDQGMAEYRQVGAISSEEDQLLNQVHDTVATYRESMPKLIAMKAAGANSNEMDAAVKGMDKPVHKALSGLKVISEKAIAQRGVEINSSIGTSKNLVIGLTVASILIAIIMGRIFINALLRQLGGEPSYAVQVAERISSGDLTGDIEVRDEHTHSLLFAMREMRGNLISVVSDVRNCAMGVATGSAEIAEGNADLSSRTEVQAGSVEETASSVEEVTSTTEKSANSAMKANELTQVAATAAQKGGNVVSEIVQTMHGINDSSKMIADIISVIDGIAFQTNILALNAAVEAARAGEQGRGFAVVATEVRALAQRSAGAAKEIKELINNSVDRVAGGMRLVEDAGGTMDGLLSDIKQVTDMVREISDSSREQNTGMGQINEAIKQMDLNTQQNAAMVEEMAAAAESLQEQAQHLLDAVAVFKLPNEGHYQAPSRPASTVKPKAVPALPKQAKPATTSVTTARAASTSKKQLAVEKPDNSKEWEEF